MNAMPRCIWIDLDNSPHVPFFRPIIQELQRLGFAVSVTARDAFNVAELLRLHRIEAKTIGRHYGKHKAMKLLGLGVRTVQLLPYVDEPSAVPRALARLAVADPRRPAYRRSFDGHRRLRARHASDETRLDDLSRGDP